MRHGYTLVEILISVSLSLFLLLGVTRLFQSVGTSITDAQGTLIMTRNLDWAATTLRNDLDNLTVDVNKPSKLNNTLNPPGDSDGYFQIIEGNNTTNAVMVDASGATVPDPTVGDINDILMFTARAPADTQFRGLIGGVGNVGESPFAEVIWFVRGNTLYRRVLLVLDNNTPLATTSPTGFYQGNDISVRQEGGVLEKNTLSDLAKRQNRFGHTTSGTFPFSIHTSPEWNYLRMPTLEECAHANWQAGGTLPSVTGPPPSQTNFWEAPNNWIVSGSPILNSDSGSLATYVTTPRNPRTAEDIILTNVISFDVKVWCPTSGQFVDLGTGSWTTGHTLGPVYDTWSSEYPPLSAPYTMPLKGIEVTIRCFDPRSKNIKQIRIVKDFN